MNDTPDRAIQSLAKKIKEEALAPLWSRGITLSRDPLLLVESTQPEEIQLRVPQTGKPMAAKVSLWPKELDWHCNCGDRNDPCVHVVAGVLKLQNQPVDIQAKTQKRVRTIHYRFSLSQKIPQHLCFERFLKSTSADSEVQLEKLETSVVGILGGLQSGRLSGLPLIATADDLQIDRWCEGAPEFKKTGCPEASELLNLFKLLKNQSALEFFDAHSVPLSITDFEPKLKAVLVDRPEQMLELTFPLGQHHLLQVFQNGAALFLTSHPQQGRIVPLKPATLTALSRYLRPENRIFQNSSILLSKVLPQLSQIFELESQSSVIKNISPGLPFLYIDLTEGMGMLNFNAQIRYDQSQGGIRNFEAERKLNGHLQSTLQLKSMPHDLVLTPFSTHFSNADSDHAIRFLHFLKQNSNEFVRLSSNTRSILNLAEIAPSDKFQLKLDLKDNTHLAMALSAWKNGARYFYESPLKWIEIPRQFFESHVELLETLIHSRDRSVHLKNTLRLVQNNQDIEVSVADPETQRRISQLLELGNPKSTQNLNFNWQPPTTLTAELRPYQHTGAHWLSLLKEFKLGALLADDMGLGKTLQVLATLQASDYNLIICPTSVIGEWVKQIKLFRPDLKIDLFHGSSRTLNHLIHTPSLEPKTVGRTLITSYALARIDLQLLKQTPDQRPWTTLVLDEAQNIKNPNALVTQAIHQIEADFRIALSGTPLENHLKEAWSLFHFLLPNQWGTPESFESQFFQNAQTRSSLLNQVAPFLMRRKKSQVAKDLPTKTESIVEVELSSEERTLYDTLLLSTRSEIKKLTSQPKQNLFSALELLLRLRQVCCHPGLLTSAKDRRLTEGSSKISVWLEHLLQVIEEGHQSLVFSQWTGYLDYLEAHLKNTGVSYLRLDGSTPNRSEVVAQFQAGKSPVLLLSLKAGGVGLNLTAADHVYLMDPWWNPATEAQATDRVYRIGQTKPVFVYRFITKNTVEEKLITLQQQKRELAEAFFDSESGSEGPSNEPESQSIQFKDLIEALIE